MKMLMQCKQVEEQESEVAISGMTYLGTLQTTSDPNETQYEWKLSADEKKSELKLCELNKYNWKCWRIFRLIPNI